MKINLDKFVPCPIFPDRYLINREGKVYSLISKKLISQRLDRYGYLRCNLYRNQKQVTITVHRLVAMAFLPNPNNLPEVNHKDGNKLNNHIDNLEWVTTSENQKHAFRIGLSKPKIGEKNPAAKYTKEDVIKVCKLLKQGFGNAEIVKTTGYSRSFVEKIKYGECWTHITHKFGIQPKVERATTIETTPNDELGGRE